MPVACFLLFLVPKKAENQYSRNWTVQKPKSIFYCGEHEARVRDGEEPPGGHTPWPRGLGGPAPGGGGCGHPGCPCLASLPIRSPRYQNPKYPINLSRNSL